MDGLRTGELEPLTLSGGGGRRSGGKDMRLALPPVIDDALFSATAGGGRTANCLNGEFGEEEDERSQTAGRGRLVE